MTSQATLDERREIDAVVDGLTLVDILARNADRFPDHPAIHWKESDSWRQLTWSGYRDVVHQAAAGLSSLGVGHGDFVAIMAGNRPEHATADLAAIHAGATGVTIYSTLTSEQIEYIANNCEAKVAVLEDLSFMKNWEAIREGLPHLRYVVLMEGAENYSTVDWVLSWDDLLERGSEAIATNPDLVRDATATIEPETIATLIYTSGTTGTPKGVVITHRNVLWTAESVRRVVDGLPPHPKMVSYLPLAHIAERMSTHYFGMFVVGEVYYCPDLAVVLEYIQQARPHLFVGVPRVWEKFHARMLGRFEENEKRDLIMKALAHNTSVLEAEQRGEKVGIVDRLKATAFDRLVFSKVRSQLGLDEVVMSITAAAPITRDLILFFNAVGIPLAELYGMSETTGPATTNRPTDNRIGTVGKPLPGVEVRLDEDGEVLMRGGVITAGYYKLPEATAESFDADGWLHSGDLGKIEDGYLSIVGRKKEIIITAAGKNIAPAKLETALKNHPLIAQACMVGDQRKFLTMVIALDGEEAPGWAESNGLAFTDLAAFANEPAVVAEVERAVEEANGHVARVEQIKRFHVVPDEWTPDSGEITPSLKLKRRVVLEKYASDIEAMYTGA